MIPGRGLRGRATPDDPVVYVGSPRFLTESGLACDGELQMHLGDCLARGEPLVCVGWEGRVRGLFVLTEELRAGVEELLSWAKSAGYRVVVLTGDYSERGAALQRALDVEVLTELLPDDKLDVVRRLRDESGPVAMIGDGANDAPALAGADVGIALGCGADVSRQTADVCLLASDLSRLPWVLGLSRQAVATIRQNLFWAFAYNAVGIVFAATGWLHPALAAAAMVASSGFVVANSLRLAAGDAGPIASDNSVAKKIPAHVSEHRAALSQAEATADA